MIDRYIDRDRQIDRQIVAGGLGGAFKEPLPVFFVVVVVVIDLLNIKTAVEEHIPNGKRAIFL